ncbi:MAG: Npt1/Npt2 family nucleotide transporter [Cytophagales bacterium]
MSQIFRRPTLERQKLLALCGYKALASFIYAIVKSLKDPLIATAKEGGAESISFVKGFIVVPASILFVFLYGFLMNKYPPRKIFYGIMLCFIGYFLLYALVLFPNAEYLSPKTHFEALMKNCPNQKYIWAAYLNWVHVTFFVASEFFAQIVIVLLFFSIANEIYHFKSAKKNYHLLIAGGFVGGLLGTFYMDLVDYIYGKKSVESVPLILLTSVFMACMLLLVYRWLDQQFLQKERGHVNRCIQKEQQLSLWENIRHLITHKRLLGIAIMVFGANLIPQLMEGIYNACLKECHPKFAGNWEFGRKVLQLSILLSIFTGFFLSGNIIRKWGWKVTAYIMPVTVLVSGTLFLLAAHYKHHLGFLETYLHCTPAKFVVYLGAAQHLLWKVAEYVFFDKTREMAYINCDANARRKGKAVIDLLGSRSGKALGNQVQTLIMCLAGVKSVLSVTLPILFCLVLACIPWFYSINRLGGVVFAKSSSEQSACTKKRDEV